MNPISGFREAWAYPAAKKTKQPKYKKYDDNCPHDISPFNCSYF